MRRLLSIAAMLVVEACGTSPQSTPKPYGSDLPPLTASGLPGSYELCARNAALKTAAVYDVYYPCHARITQYVSQIGGKTQPEKAAMVSDMEKRALSYAQQQVEIFHGAEAAQRALTSAPPSEKAPQPTPKVADWFMSPSAEPWYECVASELQRRDIYTGPIASVGVRISVACRSLFKGESGADMDIVVGVLEKKRSRVFSGDPVVIDRRPMPSMEKRF